MDQIGLVLLVAGFASILGSVLGSKGADEVGKTTAIKAASTVAAAGVLSVTWFTGHLVGTVALHTAWALAFAFGYTALNAWISELNPSMRGTLLSLSSSAMYAGMMAATALAALFLRWGGGSFIPIGVACAMAALAVFPIVSRVGGDETSRPLHRR